MSRSKRNLIKKRKKDLTVHLDYNEERINDRAATITAMLEMCTLERGVIAGPAGEGVSLVHFSREILGEVFGSMLPGLTPGDEAIRKLCAGIAETIRESETVIFQLDME